MDETPARPTRKDPGSEPAPRSRRRARHLEDNFYIGPARDSKVLEIWAYSDRIGYAPGDGLGLRVSTTAETYDIEIGRDGAVYERLLRLTELPGVHHETPEDCSIVGCDWPVATTIPIPEDWPSGGYLITLVGRCGDESVEEHHLIILRVREPQTDLLLICATTTWVAYNCWGGSNAYDGLAGDDGRRFSPILSTERPWTRGFCKLPEGAPRTLPLKPPNPGEMVRHPYMEWAYAYGYSKKYASAGWASYERHFARWAEAAGYHLDHATLHDLESDPALLDSYRCAVFVGHDEYWSRPMREAVDGWIEGGGRAARFAGNFLWQIRLEDQGRRQVCYKYEAVERDPVMATSDRSLLTGAWEQPEIGWPGAQTFGANARKGVYAGLGNCVGRGSGGFTIYRPQHWSLVGTHLGYGDVLGAVSRIYGYEVDGLDYVIRDGLPFATGCDGASRDIEIIGQGLGTNEEADHGVWGKQLYIGGSDCAWKARALFGAETSETMERAARGNGVMIHWRRGQGEVFTAATCEWVMRLTRRDPQVERVTRKVLERFLGA